MLMMMSWWCHHDDVMLMMMMSCWWWWCRVELMMMSCWWWCHCWCRCTLLMIMMLLVMLLLLLLVLYESTFASFYVPILIATLFAQLHESHGFCGRSVSTSLLCYWLNSQGTTGHCWGLQHLQLLERTAVSWTPLWTARAVLVVQLYTADHHPCSVHLFVTVYGHFCVISSQLYIKVKIVFVFTSLVPRPSHHPVKVFCFTVKWSKLEGGKAYLRTKL